MADVSRVVSFAWALATRVARTVSEPWGSTTLVTSTGGPWMPPAPPPGGTPTAPDTTTADYVIPAQSTYRVVHSIEVRDLRDDALIEFGSFTMSIEDGSICWTLSATGKADLFARFTAGDVPIISITLDGQEWRFVIEQVRRERAHAAVGVSITGRSLTILAGEPYAYPENWVNDGPASAAQIAEQAQIFTGLAIDWRVEDWLVPDRVWTFTGTPLAVVQRVAESIGAVTRAYRAEQRVAILPRYRVLPNEFTEVAPEVEIHIEAVTVETYERSDKPAYNGVYITGQQQGVVGFVRLAGTAGDKLAPMVSDLLMTDAPAPRQRGEAILGASGPQAMITLRLPILVAGNAPGVLEVGWLARVVEGTSEWYGIVRAVSVSVQFPSAMQLVTLERHTSFIEGTVTVVAAPPPAPPPPPPPPPASYTEVAWSSSVHSPFTGTYAHSNSGSEPFYLGGFPYSFFAGLTVWYGELYGDDVEWLPTWVPVTPGDPAPEIIPIPGSQYVEVKFDRAGTAFPPRTYEGLLTLTAIVGEVPTESFIEIAVSGSAYSAFAWGPVP